MQRIFGEFILFFLGAYCELAMADDRVIRRKELSVMIAELKKAALADLESRGYAVRGKTPAQIRQMLKRRPSKRSRDHDLGSR